MSCWCLVCFDFWMTWKCTICTVFIKTAISETGSPVINITPVLTYVTTSGRFSCTLTVFLHTCFDVCNNFQTFSCTLTVFSHTCFDVCNNFGASPCTLPIVWDTGRLASPRMNIRNTSDVSNESDVLLAQLSSCEISGDRCPQGPSQNLLRMLLRREPWCCFLPCWPAESGSRLSSRSTTRKFRYTSAVLYS